MKIVKRYFPWVIIVIVLGYFYSPVLKGFIPSPLDTIIGLYHPFRDLYSAEFPNGIPFKNSLITDPVRQIIPWKILVLKSIQNFNLPLWNPYSASGTPLLANFQSSTFYPLNILLLAKPFVYSWTLFIALQQLLASIFMFLYLRNLRLSRLSSVFGALTFSFSGFVIAWLEWGSIVHTILWLPLILTSIDKMLSLKKSSIRSHQFAMWSSVLIISTISSLFAGHLQTFLYIGIVSGVYFFARYHHKRFPKKLFVIMACYTGIVAAITSIQWIPTLKFIMLSARTVDISQQTSAGWFLPPQHLVQFLVPDFFGNPTTLNYWGVWNYAEFIGYIGVIPLILSALSLAAKRKITRFYIATVVVALLCMMALPHTEALYQANIPFFSSAQPTRLLSLVCFSLAVLSGFGLEALMSSKTIKNKKKIYAPIIVISIIFALLWIFVLVGNSLTPEQLSVTKRNLILPTSLMIFGSISIAIILTVKNKFLKKLLIISILVFTIFDLLRFATKFETFSKPEYFFPQTKAIEFLKNDKSIYRIATTDSRILPPNFSSMYEIQSIEVYDPLYLKNYAEFIVNNERCCGDVDPPYGFNRIITPRNLFTDQINFLNVKYILSFDEIEKENIVKVFEEGQTKIYRNDNMLPRAYFVEQTQSGLSTSKNRTEFFKSLKSFDFTKKALVEEKTEQYYNSLGSAQITKYEDNKIVIETKNEGNGFLVLSDTYYPTWQATIDGEPTKIYETNHAFRGIEVPEGKHEVVFYNNLF